MITTFEQARRLKELGFDRKTHKACWSDNRVYNSFEELYNYNETESLISAPTVSDALQFIRDQFGIECGVYPNTGIRIDDLPNGKGKVYYEFEGYHYLFVDRENLDEEFFNKNEGGFPTFPEAESALLDEALTYLEQKR